MAKGSGIELTPTPAPEVDALKALPTSPTRIHDKGRVDSVDISSGSDSDISSTRIEIGTRELGIESKGQLQDMLADDDAEQIAGLINGASLSVSSGSGANMAGDVPEGIVPEGTITRMKRFSRSLFSKGTLVGKERTGSGKFGTQQNGSHEEAPLAQRTRSSGRPDEYDVPQSPPKVIRSGKVAKSKAPKSKRILPRRGEKVIASSDEAYNITEEREAEPQEQEINGNTTSVRSSSLSYAPEELNQDEDRTKLAEKPLHHEKGAQVLSAVYNTTPKRKTRSMRARENELNIYDPQTPDSLQRTTVEKSPVLGTTLISTPSGSKATKEAHNGRENNNLHHTVSIVQHASSGPRPSNVPITVEAQSTFVELEKDGRQPDKQMELTGEDLGSMLLDPSPVKPPQKPSKSLRRPTKGPTKRPFETKTAPPEHTRLEVLVPTKLKLHDQGRKDKSDVDFESRGTEGSDHESARTGHEDDLGTSLVSQNELKNLLSIVDKAGRNAGGTRLIMDGEYLTNSGRVLSRIAERLSSKKIAINKLKLAEVVDMVQIDEKHRIVLQLLTRLEDITDSILTDRLGPRDSGGDNADNEKRTIILKDLYLYGIPNVVKALCSIGGLSQKELSSTTEDLEEFFRILKCAYKLAEGARAEPTEIQPKPNPKKSYQISKPTRQLLLNLRLMYSNIESEVKARRLIPRPASKGSQNGPKKHLLKDIADAEEEEYQHRLKERNSEILETLNARRAELGLVPCSQALVDQKRSSSQRSKVSAREEDDVFVTGLLGRNNSNPRTMPREWNEAEMKILVAGLRRERGPLRYLQLTAELERTIDEIYDRAKYLRMQIEYTLKRLQEERPDEVFPAMKPWIASIGTEKFLA